MMTTKTFTVVGITSYKDDAKVRFSNDIVRRVKKFTKSGVARIDFMMLPSAMTKIEALKFMLTRPEFNSAEDQATINDTLEDKIVAASKGEVKVKMKPSLENIKKRTRKDVSVNDVLAVLKNSDEEEWFDSNGNQCPNGAYDVAGHYYAERHEVSEPDPVA